MWNTIFRGIQQHMSDMITAAPKRIKNNWECLTLIGRQDAFNILADECNWAFFLEKTADLLKQGSFITILDTETRWILRDNRKTLTREPCSKNIKMRNLRNAYFANIPPINSYVEISIKQIASARIEIIGVD